MRALITATTFSLGLALSSHLTDPMWGGVAWLLWTLTVTWLLSGQVSAFAIFSGCAAALIVHVIPDPFLAFALLGAFMYAPRAFRARNTATAASLIAIAGATTALAVWVLVQFSAAPSLVRWSVAGLCFVIAFGIPVDDPIAARLRGLAGDAEGRLRWTLLRGVAVRRMTEEYGDELGKKTRKTLERSWDNIVDLAQHASRVHGKTQTLLLERLGNHLRTISSTCRSAASVDALSGSLSDDTLHSVIAESERYQAELQALHEVAE